jgi:predicted RNase H-like nuclease
MGLNQGDLIQSSKHTQIGKRIRLNLLKKVSLHQDWHYNWNSMKAKYSSKKVKRDDILDAWVLCIAASMDQNKIISIPESPAHDAKEIPMQISFIKFQAPQLNGLTYF